MTIKFNVEPYYDDFETATPAVDGLTPKEKYNRVLFRPGHAVQVLAEARLEGGDRSFVLSVIHSDRAIGGATKE